MRALRLHYDYVSSLLNFSAFPGQRSQLTYFWSLPSEWHSTWHAENVQLTCDEWKCDLFQWERIGKTDKSRQRTEWRNPEVTHSLTFLLFGLQDVLTHLDIQGPLCSCLITLPSTISCHNPTLTLEAWSSAETRAIWFQIDMPFQVLSPSPCLPFTPHLVHFIELLLIFQNPSPISFFEDVSHLGRLNYSQGYLCTLKIISSGAAESGSPPFLFMATPTAHGRSQARGWTRAVAADLHHSHSNGGSEPHLPPTPQLTARLDP